MEQFELIHNCEWKAIKDNTRELKTKTLISQRKFAFESTKSTKLWGKGHYTGWMYFFFFKLQKKKKKEKKSSNNASVLMMLHFCKKGQMWPSETQSDWQQLPCIVFQQNLTWHLFQFLICSALCVCVCVCACTFKPFCVCVCREGGGGGVGGFSGKCLRAHLNCLSEMIK